MKKLAIVLSLLLLLAACSRSRPPQLDTPTPTPEGATLLGQLEVTFTVDPDSQTLTTSAVPGLATQGLVGRLSTENLSNGLIDKDGFRYLYGTYRVTNNGGALSNLSFYAMNTSGAIGGTAVKDLRNAKGETLTSTTFARTILPTHRMEDNSGTLGVKEGEADFQGFAAQDINALQNQNPGGTLLEYGYSARNTSGGRAIAANGSGLVSFAIKFPFDPARSADLPFSFTLVFATVDDTATQVTRSAEEAPNSAAAVCARANAVNATKVVVIGSSLPASVPAGCELTRLNDVKVAVDVGGLGAKYLLGNGADTTPPAAPTGLAAMGGNGQVTLDWADNTETDLAGYRVYRGTSSSVSTSGAPLNGALLISSSYTDTTVTNGATYYYVVTAVDTGANTSSASAAASATPQPAPAVNVKVNFQTVSPSFSSPTGATMPSGYLADYGQPYGQRTDANQGSGAYTYGWVRQDSLSAANHVPVDLSKGTSGTGGNGRDRNLVQDQRFDTVIHMQYGDVSGGDTKKNNTTPGAWEIAVPNGTYQVTVAVGDPSAGSDPEFHTINVEGVTVINRFQPAGSSGASTRQTSATVSVSVRDGRLTLDAVGGTNTKLDYVDIASASGNVTLQPFVTNVLPGDGATGVNPNIGNVTADLNLFNGAVDETTLAGNVTLTRVSDGGAVAGTAVSSGGADTLSFNIAPSALPLAQNTAYRFEVTGGAKDKSGASFKSFSSTFTTGNLSTGGTIAFDKVASGASGKMFTSVTKGPDGKLYAGTILGTIYRYTINADGTLSNEEAINTVRTNASAVGFGGAPNRTIIGLEFDPSSTANNLILWITDNYAYLGSDVPEWEGKIAKLTGANLQNYELVVTNLPRSIKDHETNSLAFGPDGALYLTQGSNNAMGAVDGTWKREERLLSAAVLKLDLTKLPSALPIDAKTEGVAAPYDPFARNAPLTLHATGVRNAYDLVWHSNGHLYVPTNGSAAGGNAPSPSASDPNFSSYDVNTWCSENRIDVNNGASPFPVPTSLPYIGNNRQAETDYLFKITEGKYYGHPNPKRCEWVLNKGNPTSATNDPFEVERYAVGTQPDRNYDAAGVFDAGLHASANGAVEYTGGAFGGALKGKLIVVRYSSSQDIQYFSFDASGRVTERVTGVTGFTGFNQPLDITEDSSTGYLYVTELGGQKITLLKPR